MKKKITVLTATLLFSAITGCVASNPNKSELTGLGIKEAILEQRPVAISYEKGDIPEADITYLVKSGDGFRKLALIKDWANLGSKVQTADINATFEQIAAEWNAVIFATDDSVTKPPFIDEIPIPEITGEEIKSTLGDNGMSANYNQYLPDKAHFIFDKDTRVQEDINCTALNIGGESFILSKNKKEYEQGENKYANIIIQEAIDLSLGDEAHYNLSDMNRNGYLILNGYAKPLTWVRKNDLSITHFYDSEGQEIKLNPGKTCVIIISPEEFDSIELS